MSSHDRIRRLFEDVVNIQVRSDDTDLIEEGLLDSLVFVELLVGLEDTFGIQIDIVDLDIEDFRTVRQIGRLVARLSAHKVLHDR
jgi:D-alanine--poly(phosphoribitol) ligase subunit 2